MKLRALRKLYTRIKIFISRQKFLRLLFQVKCLRNYFKNGLYIIGKNIYQDSSKNKICFSLERINKNNFKLPIIFLISDNKKKIATHTFSKCYFRKHTGKMSYCFSDYVIVFDYFNTNKMNSVYLKYYKLCNYPKYDFHIFDLKTKYYITSFIKGDALGSKDIKTQISVLKNILTLNAKTIKCPDSEYREYIESRVQYHCFDKDFLSFVYGGGTFNTGILMARIL